MHDTRIVYDHRPEHSTPAPHYATHQSAGLDLTADLDKPVTLAPFERVLFPTGLFLIECPPDCEMQLRPRSGLAFKHGVTILNAPATIDADYKDEVRVLLVNLSSQAYTVQPGERIAQAVFNEVRHAPQGYSEATQTRAGGFGSTGK